MKRELRVARKRISLLRFAEREQRRARARMTDALCYTPNTYTRENRYIGAQLDHQLATEMVAYYSRKPRGADAVHH